MRRLFVLVLAFALASAFAAPRAGGCCVDRGAGDDVFAWVVAASSATDDTSTGHGHDGDPDGANVDDEAGCACDESVVCTDCEMPPLNALLRWAPPADGAPDERRMAVVGWYVTAGDCSELLRPPRAAAD
jgi:hypothetical protein